MRFGVYVNMVFFLGMGLLAIISPSRLAEIVHFSLPDSVARNEVRAVYGGFGLAIAGMLVIALRLPAYRDGVVLCIGVALLGMAFGRLVSFAVDGSSRRAFGFFFLEVSLATLLLTTLPE